MATVLAMEPEILVLDEPSSNLDPASRRELADILRSLDVTVLMVTHDLPYALELCPRSVVLSDGVVVADGPTYDVLTDDAADARAPARAAVRLRPATDRHRAAGVEVATQPVGADRRRGDAGVSDADREAFLRVLTAILGTNSQKSPSRRG